MTKLNKILIIITVSIFFAGAIVWLSSMIIECFTAFEHRPISKKLELYGMGMIFTAIAFLLIWGPIYFFKEMFGGDS